MSIYIYWNNRDVRQDPTQGGDVVADNESVLRLDLLLTEELLNDSVLTEHVVERTTSISDYYYREPYILRLNCMHSQTISVSNQDFDEEDGIFELTDLELNGKRHQQGKYSSSVNNRINNTITTLRNIINYKSSVEIVGIRYPDINWMITSLIITRNQELSNVIEIELTLKEILRADIITVSSPQIERARSRSGGNNGTGNLNGSRDDGEIPTAIINQIGR